MCIKKTCVCIFRLNVCLHVFVVLISMCIRLKCVKNDFMFRCLKNFEIFFSVSCVAAAADATTASEKKLLKT